uniref:Spectrin repeat containing nuclear envelope protein 1 n=1 Tax=Oncorhynchus kisutch TaxID=8019 RepID=A0A8C7FND7_ONCKI
GVMLLALLEVLSGQKLPCEQGRKLRRIHWVSNIGTALNFLEGRKIKLVNINSTDIVDGRPSIVLGLIWTIILYFQIEELTSNLPALQALSSSTSSVDSSDTTSPPVKRRPLPPLQGGARKALLRWVQQTATKHLGIDMKDFGPSWRTGVAFFAVILSLRPHLVDMERVRRRANRENLQEAFSLAETELGIPQLLDPEDVDVDKPDEKSIMTYVAQFLKHHPNPGHQQNSDSDSQPEEEVASPVPLPTAPSLSIFTREQRKGLRELKTWLDQLELDTARTQETKGNLSQQYQSFKSVRVQLEMNRKQVEAAVLSTQKDGMLTVDQALVKQAWDRVSNRLLGWHLQLDRALPAPLGVVGEWLHQAEGALRQEVTIQQTSDATSNTVHMTLEQHKVGCNDCTILCLEGHQQVFQRIHKDRSVNGVPVPPEQLQDMAERMNFVSTSSNIHLAKMEFWENKHHMQAFLMLAESKLKSWIIKYGRRESVELMLQNYVSFVEGQQFFEQYETLFQTLKQSSELYVKADGTVDEGEAGVRRFMREVLTQWRSLSVEVRSVRSMLDEVLSNWERYSCTVASLQAWLEDAEGALSQPENIKREFFRNLSQWMDQHSVMNDAGNFLIETCDETVSRDLKQQLLLLNGRWRDLFVKVKQYAREDELDKCRRDHMRAISALRELLDGAELKLNAPVQVSFLNIRSFLQDVENTKKKVVAMETQYKLAACSAQLLSKDAPQEEGAKAMATMTMVKGQLSKVGITRGSHTTTVTTLPTQHHYIFTTLCALPSKGLLKEVGEWRRQEEANSTMRRRFEESRQELERVLKVATTCLGEGGNAEELLRKQSEFFGQLDQRVLSVFLKACDDLTDILPEEEQQALQDTVRTLHKQWKDIQMEAPFHLQRLKVEAERGRAGAVLQECRAELAREIQALTTTGSETVIREHRAFFREKAPLSVCEKSIGNMEELCQTLPDNDSARQTLDSTRRALADVKGQIEATHLKLQQHSQWREWNDRFSELSDWLLSQRSQVRLLRERARDRSHLEQRAAEGQEESLSWLNSRLAVLTEVSPEVEAIRQRAALAKLSSDLTALLSSLLEVNHLIFLVMAIQLSSCHEGTVSICLQGLHKKSVEYVVQTDSLSRKAAEIQLGPKNQTLLQQQAQQATQQVTQLEESLQEQTALRETLQQRESSLLSFSSPEAQQQLQGQREDCLQPLSEAQHLLLLRGESLAELGVFLKSHGAAAGEVRGLREAVEGRGSWDRSKAEELHHGLGEVAGDVARLEAQAVGLDGRLSKAHLHLSGAEWKGSKEGGLGQGPGQGRTSCRGQAVALMVALEGVQRGLGWRQSQAEALGALWTSFRERREEVMRSLRELEERARQEGARESSVQAFQNSLRFFVQLEEELQSLQHSQQWLRERGSQLAQRDSELAGEALREVGLVETAWENRIQTNAERIGHCVSLWDDLKTMERDIDQWAAASIADLTEGVANLSDKQGTETHLATFQVRPMTVNTLSPLPPPQDLQSALQQQRGDIDMARETLSSLCRSHPSQELTHMSSDLTLLAKRTEAAAQLSSRTRGTLQDALQLRFNSEQRVKLGFCVAQERVEEGEQHLGQVCGEAERLLLHLPKAGSGQVQERLSSCQRDWEGYKEGYVALPSLSPPRSSLDRLSQEAQSLREAGRGCGGEVKATAQLQTHHQTLLQGTRERLRGCLESQAFGETLHGVWLWLEDIQERLGSLGSTMGNKKELEERLEQVQDILLLKGEGEVKLNMAVGKGELAIRSNSVVAGQEVIRSQLQEVEDVWATLLVTAMSCHSRLEWTVAQWGCYLDSEAQLQCWLEAVEGDICGPLIPQPGLREKASQLERLQTLLADLQEHQGSLSSLEERAAELFKKTGDAAFSQEARAELQGQFDDLIALVEVRKVGLSEGVVREHQQYLETVRELTDWLMSAGEELQRWSDTLGDSVSLQRRLSEVIKDVCDSSLLEGRDRLSRVRRSSGATAEHTAAGGCEAMDRQLGALAQALEQWEGAALRARDGLERALTTATEQEQEYERLTARMEEELRELDGRLKGWSQELSRAEGRSSGEEAVEGWQQETLEGLLSAEPMADRLKAQLNDLVRYSRDLGPHSDRVTALIKQHNSLSLRASRECQNKERLLEQRFRAALRDFQQWLVNVKISTAKCFDIPQSVTEASTGLLRIQEFLNDREHGQARLSAVGTSGELLMAVVPKDREEGVKAKVANARDDWKSLMTNLQMRETALKNLQSQMRDFEVSTEPLQDWLNSTEVIVQESSARLHDLPAKRQELSKLQRVLEELSCREAELGKLRERAHRLWEGHAAGKGFVHRVSQLSAQYLALSNLTKDKASRIERIVGEHRLFSQGLTELQNWVSEAERILNTCLSPTADKTVLEDRMIQLEALLAARQEREIQLKMLLTRGEAVQRNTSAEGVPVVRKQIQDLKDSWDSLLSASIQCKRSGDIFIDRQYSEMRDKTANLGKTKAAVYKAKDLVLAHQEYQRGLHMFEDWLEQEQGTLGSLSHPEGDVDTLENTLQQIQLLQERCSQGQSLLSSLLSSRDGVIPWGAPQIEDRALDTAQREWGAYQARLGETRATLGSTLGRLRQMGQRFQSLVLWLEDMEGKANIRGHRRSDSASKDAQLKQLQLWQESVLARQTEVDGLSALAQQVLEETHISSRVSTRATQLTARYHALILNIQETIKQLKEELRSIEEAEKLCVSFSDWLRSAQKNFRTVTASTEALDRVAMERKMKKVEVLNTDTPGRGHGLLKALRERAERAADFLEEAGAEGLGGEVEARLAQLEELAGGLRQEHSTLERALLQTVQSHDSAVRLVVEKGESLLLSVQYPSIRDNMNRLQTDYTELGNAHVQRLEGQVKEQEVYHVELQEVERWLLQMSSRMVTPDPAAGGGLEAATQQLASHKVYQSLDRELQRHVSLQDALQQCQTWLVSVSEEPEPTAHLPLSLEEALQQVKHERTLQEQASTYLQLVCSTCDLSEQRVRETAQDIQQVKLQVSTSQYGSLATATDCIGNVLTLVSEFLQQLRVKQVDVTQLREAVAGLTEGQSSPALEEMGGLRRAWEELGQRAEELEGQRGEDMQRSGEYHDCVAAVEELFHQVSREWDYLARADTESTSEHLEALRKLCCDLEDQRGTLEELRDQRQAVLPRLSLLDKELVKQQVGHLEKRWSQLDSLIQGKIQDSSQTLEDLGRVEAQLREAREWMEEQRPALTSALKTSPPPDLAQSFLFDHLSVCVELEARGQLLGQAVSEAQRVASRLGLSERRRLQELVLQAEGEVEALGARVSQRRKKYFKVDLDRTCHWLRRADGITFPEIDFTCNADDDSELQGRLAKFQNVLEQASEYENLLLIVQRVGQEILPSLKEVDHCYLDEKLNALPQQYNSILALAKEKRDRIQQAILERKDYDCFFNVTCRALEELQEQLDGLAKRTVSIQEQEVVHLRHDHRDLSESLSQLSPAVRELRRKTEGFLSRGQRCHAEETEQLVNLHDNLKRTIDQRLKHLDDSLKTLAEYNATSAKLDSELKSVKEQFTRMKSDSDTTLGGTERLTSLYTLLEDLERMGSHLERLTRHTEDLGLNCDPAAIQASREVVTLHQKELQSVRSEVKYCVTECENCLKKDKEFEKETGRTSDWLKSLRKKLGEPLTLPEVKVEMVEEEVRRLKVVEEEVQSRMRVADAMGSREKQRYSSRNEACPTHVDANLEELAKLRADVQQALRTKQTLFLVQRHQSTQQSARKWLDEAGAFLQRTTLGIELENQTESLRELEEISAQEPAFVAKLDELETLGAQLDGLVGLGVTKEMKESERKKEGVEVMRQKGSESLVILIDGCEPTLTGLKEKATDLALVGSESSKAAIGHSVSSLWQRWTRLRSVARAQERALEDTARDWRSFREKVVTTELKIDLHARVPDSTVEKAATRAALQNLLEYHDSFSLEVEREQSALALLGQHTLSLIGEDQEEEDMDMEKTDNRLTCLKTHFFPYPKSLQPVVIPYCQSITQTAHGEVISRRQSVERMVELQQNKYQDLQAALPSELSMQLAEVTLALGSAEDQVPSPSGTPPLELWRSMSLTRLLLSSLLTSPFSCPTLCTEQAEQQLEEYKGMRQFLLGWAEKAETLVTGNIIWSSASQLQEQIRAHQAVLRECRGLHGDLEAMGEREGQLGEVLQTEGWSQQVKQLSRCTEELQQSAKTRLQSLQDAAKDMVRLEAEVKTLHDSLDQAQLTLTSPDLARLSLREQLTHRQRLLVEMEAFKQQVQAVQLCQSALRLPEEVVASLSICRTAQSLQQEASQLQHTTIQQCNILQEAVVQYEQYEQEVRNLQRLIEEAHRIIQDRPVSTSNIHELQAQIHHHEELALKIRGYQEQIASLNSKCKMLTVKAKHATMLLTVSEVEGLSDGMDELSDEELPTKQPPAHPSVVMMTAGRCHTLLSPVTEESGEEGTNSEVSSPACRSPSPGANADTPLNQVLHRRTPQLPPTHSPELYDPSLESNANLDDLQRSWETLKNVISEKQKTLYEALERQQHYQESLQSISTKMESIEGALNEGLESRKSPESQMAAHQALMDEILMLQDEIGDLQTCFSEELCDGLDSDSDPGDQLALHSTLTVLGERMATIRMKASGKRQLLEERLSEQLEEQRQEQALQRYHSEAEELDHWLLSTKATLSSALQPHPEDMDMEEQLIDCQNMLFEIEQKVASLSELSVHSESLLLEGRAGTRGEAEQLTFKLHSLKDSLVELQRMLQDKQVDIQGSLQEQEDSEPDSILSQSPNIQDWLSQARSTRTQQHHDNLLRQKVGYDIALSCTCTISLYCTMTLHISFPLECPEGVADNKQDVPRQDVPRGVSVQEELYAAVSAASSWLDSAENNVLSGPVLLSEDTETQLSNLEGLSKEVREVTGEMSKCRELLGGGGGAAGGGRRLYGGEEQALMEDTLDGLQERLGLLDQTLEQHCDCMRDRLQEHTGFQTELRLLFTALSESKHQLLQRTAGAIDRPAPKQMETLSEVEDGLREFEQRVAELRSRAEGRQPDQISNQELLKLQDAYEELVLMVGSRRSSLNHSLSLKAQYESALHDLTDLVDTAQDKMAADQKMTVGSVIEVQILLDKHKEFFQGLECHMILTQTFYSKVSGLVVQRESQVLEETLALANNVLKQAHRRGVELEGILESWSMLVEDYQALYRQLEAVECSIPTVGLVEETEERLSDRITLYQRLKTSLTEHQPQLYQVMEEGKRLLLSVCCSDLENQLTQLGEHWLCSTTKVNKELHRFDSTLKHWSRYQSESAELSQWLRSALDRLEFWTTQSVTVPQELETVRDHLYAFLEFSKEVDAKSSLRSSVLSTGNQLLRLKRVDTAGLRSALAQVDTQWAELFTRIPVVQEKLHQLQMEKLASRHAITELMSWISLMENVIAEDQQRIMGAVGSEVVQDYLQKYKGFSIDLTCKQLTVDFVNQSVLQISSQDVEGKRSDKTDFAERLGAMNRRWQILQGLIIEKIQLLEGLLERWMEHENGVQALKTWLTLQEDKLKKRHRIDDVASVQNALKDCQELEELVKEKEKDLEKAEERGSGLIQEKRGQACSVVMETLKGLNKSWANLDNMIGQMKVSLRSVLEQWTLYRRAAEEINGYLMEGRYSVSRLHLLTGSLEAVQQQVESLENLQEELDKQESSLRKFGSVTHQLLTECHPSVADTLDGALRDVNIRWNGLLEQISEQLRSSKALLGLWQRYTELYDQSVSAVHKQEERADRLLKSATDRDVTEEESNAWIRDCSELLGAQATVQQSLLQLQQLGEQLKTQIDASSMAALQSDCLSLTHRLATLEHALHRQQEVLQVGHLCYSVTKQLDSLTCQAEEAEEVLRESDPVETPDHTVIQERMEKLKSQMCKLSSHSPDLERVNELAYRLPLNDREIKRLQSLNRAWTTHSAHLTERFSKLMAVLLQQQSFLQKCEDWMDFLSQTEQKLAAETSGNYHSLLEQQRDHELFQTEMFSRQQILYSIISDGHHLLDQGQVDDRDDFSLKLALLGNQWQGVVRRAQQRRGIIDSLVRQWQRYREMAEKLRRWLQEVSRDPEVHQQGEAVALQEARTMLDQIQLRERVLQRQQGGYILAVEAGRSLLLSADAKAESALQTELMDMQECWRHANVRLDEQKRELLSLLKDWGRCEKGIAASLEKLRAFKRKLSLPLPDNHEELHSEQVRCKELESNVDGWTDDLTSLFLLRDSLEGVVSADDLTVLQDRLQLLQRQWEEICHQLSLRRQQVSEKLNEWAVFNEKNKDLCEWLTQMESKVSQNGDISIQEMIEKLHKDYQEEIGVAQENKQQLQVMGERLARASHESKAAEIQHKLSKVSERWQHLLDLIAARVKKLRETLVAVQQLDKNMCSLRSWLAHIETELTRPLVYDTCDAQEIQRKLNQQQDIQRDIEKHSTGVASVLNLCEVLLHDCDACSTETECDSIQQATRGLDRRWRNICAMSMERRLKIEETWRLWQKFLDDFSRFEEWLKTSERTAALPNSSGVLYTIAKEELKKFEAFQRQVQEFLTQLELINKQYRRLARENRTDSSCRLREMVHDGNRRWDNLQKRVASILRRLKHFIGQREEFETARDSILVWLTEMDLQLTNIEHFSECDVQAKIKQLRAFQQEISLNTGQIELVFRQGEALIEKSEPLDGAVLEEELEELQRYWQEVFGRVDRYYKKLTRLPLADDELDCSDRDLDMDESADLSDLQWGDSSLPCPSSLPTSGSVLPPQADRSGRDTPASMDSIPLEWDHDYDLSRGLESAGGRGLGSERGRGQEQEEEYLRSAAAVLSGEPGQLEAHLRQLDQAVDSGRYSVQQGEAAACSGQTSTSPELDSTYMGYMRLMGECRGSIDAVKRAGGQLTEEDDDMPGLTNPTSTDSQSAGVIERWELIQARSLRDKHRQKQNLQQCHQLISDLQTMRAWLCEAEAELGQLRVLDLSTDIHTIQQRIRKLKELQKAMDGHKSQVLSINLSSADFLQSDPDSKEAWELRDGLKEMNSRWDWLGSSLEDWRAELQRALMQCQEFHELSHGLLLWLENIDRRRNEVVPIPPRLDRETLRAHHRTLTQIKRELLDSQQKASSLQELSAQLLVHTQGSEHLEAQEKVHVIGNRLRLLLREVSTDLEGLERRLETMDTQPRGKSSHSGAGCASSRSDFPLVPSSSSSSSCPPRGQSFILRVLRAALPLQLLLLLLIGLACLVPMTEEDYSCHHANNFARSFHPMLRYTNGPPPI